MDRGISHAISHPLYRASITTVLAKFIIAHSIYCRFCLIYYLVLSCLCLLSSSNPEIFFCSLRQQLLECSSDSLNFQIDFKRGYWEPIITFLSHELLTALSFD